MKKVLISGGSGMVGNRLTELLMAKGYEVAHLSRSASSANSIKTIQWNIGQKQLEASKIEGYNHIIHLAGAGIVDESWTEERKQLIRDSRVKSAELLYQAIKKNSKKPLTFTSASAVGYYGFKTSDHVFAEKDPPGNDFLADICEEWEKSVDKVETLGVAVSKIRIGIVLSEKGGALKEMARPTKFGVGAPLGSGKQYMPWIHIDDLCALFIHAMENQLVGAFNAASDQQTTNEEFTRTLAKTLKKPLWLPNVPTFMMKIILGSRALLVLEGSRVSNDKIKTAGFSFQYKSLESALSEIYS